MLEEVYIFNFRQFGLNPRDGGTLLYSHIQHVIIIVKAKNEWIQTYNFSYGTEAYLTLLLIYRQLPVENGVA